MHTITKSKFTVKYKVLYSGVWDNKILTMKVEAQDFTDAIGQVNKEQCGLNVFNKMLSVQIVSISDSYTGSNPAQLELNREYTTLNGTKVTMKEIHNIGSDYETMSDQFGINRYSRRAGDLGRCTGAMSIDPMNIKMGASWFSRDFDSDAYDEQRTDINITHVRGHKGINYVETDFGYTFQYRGVNIRFFKVMNKFFVDCPKGAVFDSKAEAYEFIDKA